MSYCTTFPPLLSFFCLSLSYSQAHSLSSSLSITPPLSLPLLFPTYLPHKQACFLCICMFAPCTHTPGFLKLRIRNCDGLQTRTCLTYLCYSTTVTINPVPVLQSAATAGRSFCLFLCLDKAKNNDRKYAKSQTNTIQIHQPNSFKQIACNPCHLGELGHQFRDN